MRLSLTDSLLLLAPCWSNWSKFIYDSDRQILYPITYCIIRLGYQPFSEDVQQRISKCLWLTSNLTYLVEPLYSMTQHSHVTVTILDRIKQKETEPSQSSRGLSKHKIIMKTWPCQVFNKMEWPRTPFSTAGSPFFSKRKYSNIYYRKRLHVSTDTF